MSQVIEVVVDEQRLISFPATIGNRLGLFPGTTLVVEEGDQGNMLLRIQPEPPTVVDEGGVLVIRGELLGDLTNVIRHEHDRRVADLIERVGL